jgi:hypothetical protein
MYGSSERGEWDAANASAAVPRLTIEWSSFKPGVRNRVGVITERIIFRQLDDTSAG